MRRAFVCLAFVSFSCAEPAASVPAPVPAPALSAIELVPAATVAPADDAQTIVISGVGDCALGSDADTEKAPGSFHVEIAARGGDLAYPFSGVVGVLSEDDLTIANLETPLTRSMFRTRAAHTFRGEPEFARMLALGSVELVDVANNHSHDAGDGGHRDTLAALREAGVGAFGYELVDRRVVKGLEIVNLGFLGGPESAKALAVREVRRHKRADNFVIVSFHWGGEGSHEANDAQLRVGRATIDAGADLVLGHHPHVLQGIEERGGNRIVYSLGNFVFGGHSQPSETDSAIYQEVLRVVAGRVVDRSYRLVPVSITSSSDRNDFRPALLEGADRDRVLVDVATFSQRLLPGR